MVKVTIQPLKSLFISVNNTIIMYTNVHQIKQQLHKASTNCSYYSAELAASISPNIAPASASYPPQTVD